LGVSSDERKKKAYCFDLLLNFLNISLSLKEFAKLAGFHV
jgi:hypothetical protein